MSLQTVLHNSFGHGTIVSVEEKYLTVNFGKDLGEKTFVYPDAFENFLTYDNTDEQNKVSELIRIKKEKRKKEEELKAEAAKKAAERAEEERKKIIGTHRAPTKKPVKRKKTVEEVLDEVING